MTGAGGFIRHYMFNRPAGGRTIGKNSGGLFCSRCPPPGAPRASGSTAKIRISRRAGGDLSLSIAKASGVTSVAVVRSQGAGRFGGVVRRIRYRLPRVLQAALGLPIRVIDGYKGTSDIRLATESGELAGSCLSWDSYKTTWRKQIESGEVNPIIQVMPKKHPELAAVASAMDYAKTDEAKKLIKHGAYDLAYSARHILAPDAKRGVEILRKAFADVLKDATARRSERRRTRRRVCYRRG